ncbi:hypothetical protein BX616_002975 [Lobosporangium transversale]|uniref:Uncharacterized protein n=1 Tax=Lobosporangium transversale TaxID=64571 RepID=A0A1Y2GBK4_9FUNG|nr:hypothetical protein BCR41DRAFT_361118 [Lobosporangium transversale]KAF9919006.1 hypothetical protein BX616_002975 [Lobosporangium transversale]ORZ06354.1 hypothetical protein BCR41DRAFT_361118 [Lobosporangium transversale]|eukprot:XP_021877517.1 hypothetical protein BCR41DRAFT_361118 [Lobosporangium transversale]
MATPIPPPFPSPRTTIIRPSSSAIRATTSATTSRRSRPRTTSNTTLPTFQDDNTNNSNNNGSGGSLSGGAIAGLIVGLLFILVCSVAGGMFLLKKRRRRMMVAGRVAQKPKGQYGGSSNDDNDDEKGRGGVPQLLSNLISKTRKAINREPKAKDAPTVAVPDVRNITQLHQAQLRAMNSPSSSVRAGSPATGMFPPHSGSSFPTHQSGSLPPTGPLPLPPLYQATAQNFTQQQPPTSNTQPGDIANTTIIGQTDHHQHQPQYQYQQHHYQPSYQQQPPSGTFAQHISTPASQPYFYQPGTGLVSVPLSLPVPHHQPPLQTAFLQQPPQQQPLLAQSPQPQSYQPIPSNVNKIYTASPTSITPLSGQPVHQYQPTIGQWQASASFPPPPQTSSPTVIQPKSTTPDACNVFLPGDASRPLLGQGLFKIVPDAEDEEMTQQAITEERIAVSKSIDTPNDIQLLQLNLGDEFLKSVMTFENQDQRFQNLEADRAVSPVLHPSNQSEVYPDMRNALSDGKGLQNDKQELNEYFHEQQDEQPPIVIVGSDIVLEPLPSAKAAAMAAREAASNPSITPSVTKAPSQESLRLQKPSTIENVKPSLHRKATIGAMLPTMGTEEYLERTDDKEEYSFGLHGDRRTLAGSSLDSAPITHPPTMVSLAEGAQGDILSVDEPVMASSIFVAGGAPPPPLIRSTKPNAKKSNA